MPYLTAKTLFHQGRLPVFATDHSFFTRFENALKRSLSSIPRRRDALDDMDIPDTSGAIAKDYEQERQSFASARHFTCANDSRCLLRIEGDKDIDDPAGLSQIGASAWLFSVSPGNNVNRVR